MNEGVLLDLIAEGRASYMAEAGATRWSGQELTEDEETGLLRGLDAGLIQLTADGRGLALPGFPTTKVGLLKSYRLFSHWKDNAYWSWRESFIQIAVAVELVLDGGWPADSVALEAFDFDIACVLDDAPIVLIEAKVDARDLDAQRRVLLGETSGATSTDLNRRRDLVLYRPAIYGGVAPGDRRWYDVAVDDESIRLTQRGGPTFEAINRSR